MMTSAAYKSADMGGRHAESRGFGLVIFAAVMLGLIGFLNLIDGIAADIVAIWGPCAYGSRENIQVGA